MAYLKVDKKASGQYIRIVESYRDQQGKSKNRTLYHLGRVSDYTPSMLENIGKRLIELGGGDVSALLEHGVKELGRYNYGFYQIYYKQLKYYGLDKLFTRITKQHKLGFNLCNAMMLMLVERLHDPVSKRSNYFNQQDYLGIGPVDLQHLYRGLDKLSDYSQVIQRQIFHTDRHLFNLKIDVVFYDVTTFYFDSQKEDGFREKGFGKDGKLGKVQVVVGLLIDQNKNPIGYQLYKGSQYEGHTLEDAVHRLKDLYQLGRVIVIADRGMLSSKNLDVIKDNGFEFIMGERLKNLPSTLQSRLLDINNYQQEWIYSNSKGKIPVHYFTLQHEDKTIIGTYSEKRAGKDAREREEKLAKAEELLKTPSKLKRKAHHYYLKATSEQHYELDVEKIKQSEKYDGFLAIATNVKDLPTIEVLDQYRHLFQIEHAFRTFKSHLETRPMFHWTPKRIEGHFCLCYIAYALQNQLRLKLEKAALKLSEEQIRKVLSKMQVSLVKQNGEQYYLRSNNQGTTDQVIQKSGVKKLPNLIHKSQIIRYI